MSSKESIWVSYYLFLVLLIHPPGHFPGAQTKPSGRLSVKPAHLDDEPPSHKNR